MDFTRNLAIGLCSVALAACAPDTGDDGPGVTRILQHASRSSTIAISDDGARVAMVNPDDGSLSIFSGADNTRTAQVATGANPSSVVIAADGKTAFVANRGDGTVVRIAGIDTATPAVDATVNVGSEPTGLALSPTGTQLFVAEFAESRVSVIDTRAMTIAHTIPVDRPRAVMVTNNLDSSDDDETLIVPEYFGTPVPGQETKDDGRTGVVHLVSLKDLTKDRAITLGPVDSGFPSGGVAGNPTVHASPNQLGAVAVVGSRIYVTSVSASPDGAQRFDNNVFPVVYVGDLDAAAEVTDASGTANLARLIYDANPSPSPANPRFIPGDLSDLAFVDGSGIGYAIGRAGDVMVRVTFADTVSVGSTQNTEIDLAGSDALGKCQGPTGVAIDSANNKAYVNCWVTRRMAVVDLGAQQMVATTEASAQPADDAGKSVLRGKRFFFTGRGRWSAAVANGAKGGEGWSACSSCHPDGLSDNVTWSFGSGPRQSTSLDGTFAKTGDHKQRILNWTGIFDELHDFERNTRGVSGGLGAITTAPTPADCNALDKETPVDIGAIGGLGAPLKTLADDATVATCGHKDWDDITAWVKTVQPPQARKALDAAAVARGRQLFADGGCAKCHGGEGWTVSRLYYTPTNATNAALSSQAFQPPAFFPSTWAYAPRSEIGAQPPIPQDLTGPAEATAVPVGQAACVLRNVGTFGVPGDATGTDTLEVRLAAGSPVRAEGRGGYNVPSLYGLALGAPYLHHGQSPSLEDLFENPAWVFHTNAANANFSVKLGQGTNESDLIAFLFSLDASAQEFDIPSDPATGALFDACPTLP